MLGDIVNTDPNYGGDSGVLSLSYFRDKALQLQTIVNAVDSAARAAADIVSSTEDVGLANDLQSYLDDYARRKNWLKTTVEAVNLGAAAINAAGGRFPVLSSPAGLGGLGLGPFVLTPAIVLALGSIAAIVTWGAQFVSGLNQRMKIAADSQTAIAAANQISDPSVRDNALRELARMQAQTAQIEAANSAINDSPWSSLASIAKWAAIALGGYMAYKLYVANRD